MHGRREHRHTSGWMRDRAVGTDRERHRGSKGSHPLGARQHCFDMLKYSQMERSEKPAFDSQLAHAADHALQGGQPVAAKQYSLARLAACEPGDYKGILGNFFKPNDRPIIPLPKLGSRGGPQSRGRRGRVTGRTTRSKRRFEALSTIDWSLPRVSIQKLIVESCVLEHHANGERI